ncbi:MAG: hypothetical protein RLZZ385_134 [Pseudomonadota bacterium]|jgi:RNA polymerase sigma-70 factor (ECF subfamily)
MKPIYCSTSKCSITGPLELVHTSVPAEELTGNSRSTALNNSVQMDHFLAGIQNRAFRMAQIATGNADDALDVVQDAMFKLVEKYHDHDPQEWRPLFYRILHSRINDWHRRNTVRNRFRSWLSNDPDDDEDPIQVARDDSARSPEAELQTSSSMARLQQVLSTLPLRQQQAFLLRAWEGLDVRQTALAMSCAEGSVKTHYSRAIHTLREQLGEYWP